jgi:hypothetical protein
MMSDFFMFICYMASDNYQFAKSEEVQGVDKYSPYEEKQFQYIPDINSGVYANNSGLTTVQFDLASIYSSNKFTDTSDLFLTIPLVMTAKHTAANGTPFAPTASAWAMCSLKNGFHHLIHQAELKVNGKTLHDSQGFTNIAKNFKLLSSMTESDLKNMASSLGMSDCLDSTASSRFKTTAPGAGVLNGGIGVNNNRVFDGTEVSLGYDAKVGFQGSSAVNSALAKRAGRIISLASNANEAYQETAPAAEAEPCIMTADNLNEEFKSHFRVIDNTCVWYDLAVIPLRYILDSMDKFGLVRKLDAQLRLYLNTGSGFVLADSVAEATPRYGQIQGSTFSNTCPMTLNISPNMLAQDGAATNYVAFGLFVKSAPNTGIGAGAVNFGGLPANAMPSCRCYYSQIELAPGKSLEYINSNRAKEVVFENFITNAYNAIPSGGTFSQLVQAGIKAPLGCLIIPFVSTSQPTQVGGPIPLAVAQYGSPSDTAPATSSPISLTNLQVQVGGKNQLSSALQYTFENFLQQVSLADTQISELNLQTGVFNQAFWENNRMYYVDLTRSSSVDKENHRQLSVSFKNNSKVSMDCLIFTIYASRVSLDVETGVVSML